MKKSEALTYFGLINKPFAWNAESGNDLVKVNREGEGQVSIRNGYSTLYSNNENKRFMRRGEWNYMFRLISSFYYYLQHGGLVQFDEDVCAEIGGYAKGAILAYYDSLNHVYTPVVSCKDNNTANYVQNPNLIDGENWAAPDKRIFPYYEKMEMGSWDGNGEWTAPYNCWVYFQAAAFQSAVLWLTKQDGVNLTNPIMLAESTYKNTLRHGSTSFCHQFLCSAGDTFKLDGVPNKGIAKDGTGGSDFVFYSNGDAKNSTNGVAMSISYCPVRN